MEGSNRWQTRYRDTSLAPATVGRSVGSGLAGVVTYCAEANWYSKTTAALDAASLKRRA